MSIRKKTFRLTNAGSATAEQVTEAKRGEKALGSAGWLPLRIEASNGEKLFAPFIGIDGPGERFQIYILGGDRGCLLADGLLGKYIVVPCVVTPKRAISLLTQYGVKTSYEELKRGNVPCAPTGEFWG